MARVELYGMSTCQATAEMRDWLELRRIDFDEYDVEVDAEARRRLRELTNGQRTVPMLVEDGKVTRIGWQGRGCVIGE